jgi:hypothetical protein
MLVGRRDPQTSVVLTGFDSTQGLLEKEKAAEEEAADKQRRALYWQQEEEVDGVPSKPPPLGPRLRSPGAETGPPSYPLRRSTGGAPTWARE